MKFHIVSPTSPLAWRIVLPEEMRAADRRAIDLGLPGAALMELAGYHLARITAQGLRPGARIAVCAGPGNNGGDGSVAARHLHGWGFEVHLLLCAPPARLQGDAAAMWRAACAAGIETHVLDSIIEFGEHAPSGPYDCIVDALLGTGARGEIGATIAEAIRWISATARAEATRVIAADIPSGVCGETGRLLGEAVRADATVTFVASKPGHWLCPTHTGALHIVDIGMQSRALEGIPLREVLSDQALARAFAPRPADLHKGQAGHLLVLAGAPGRTGAARLCAEAALRAGVGLVSLALPAAAIPLVAPALCEVMYQEAFSDPDPIAAARHLAGEAHGRDALVLGPGMPTDAHAGATLRALLPQIQRPVVLDADALNHLAADPEQLQVLENTVITPHPGEAARLLGTSTADVQADRFGAVAALARRTGAVAVLKGAHTLIATPDGRLWLCPAGNPGMASAGMGDVLAGIIGALLARGHTPQEAACAGVLWHARAGDHACSAGSQNALIARDVIDALVEVQRRWPSLD